MRFKKFRINSGITQDLKGRAPWYKHDWTEGVNCSYRSVQLTAKVAACLAFPAYQQHCSEGRSLECCLCMGMAQYSALSFGSTGVAWVPQDIGTCNICFVHFRHSSNSFWPAICRLYR